jgi:hypothetical protein
MSDGMFPEAGWTAAELNTGQAHPARVYDYWLGGKNNYPADQEVAD